MKQVTWLLLVIVMISIVRAQSVHSQRANAQAQGETPQQPRDYLDLPINIEAPIQPIPAKGDDGKWYLVYHLFLTNWSFSDLTLKSVEVFDGERSRTLGRYEDRAFRVLSRQDAHPDTRDQKCRTMYIRDKSLVDEPAFCFSGSLLTRQTLFLQL